MRTQWEPRCGVAQCGAANPLPMPQLRTHRQIPGVAWETTPLDIAGALSKGLMQAVCVSSVRYCNRLKGVTEVRLASSAVSPGSVAPSCQRGLMP